MDDHEFFAELQKVRRAGFTAYLDGSAIQLNSPTGDKHDPVTAVCVSKTGKVYPMRSNYLAAQSIGLSNEAVSRMIKAIYIKDEEPQLRNLMLEALKLQE